MNQPAIVLFGTVEHPTLTLLYHYLKERGRRRVVYLSNEAFPGEPGFGHELSQDFEGGRFLFADQPPVDFDNVVSVGLDGFFVRPPDLEVYSERDQEYIQTESWAALIAIFAALSRKCPVANHILRRDDFNSRIAMLGYLHSHGVPIPEVCVSSDPEEARRFINSHDGRIWHRPVAVRELPFSELSSEDAGRLERLPLCPVHFEQRLESRLVNVVRVGPNILTEPADIEVPESLLVALQGACEGLDLHLAEISLREGKDGWVCTSLYPFLRPPLLSNPEVAEVIAEFFEGESGQ